MSRVDAAPRPVAQQARPGALRVRALVEVTAIVVAWMALGWALRVDAYGYLLLGIPLTAAFQLAVRRRPLRELWVARSGRFHLDRTAALLAALLVIAPAFALPAMVAAGRWLLAAWLVAAVGGAVAAGYALRQLRRSHLRSTLTWIAIPSMIGIAVMAASAIAAGMPRTDLPAVLGAIGRSLLLYLPAVFVVEEVTFRGALDSHSYRRGERHGALTALFVSVLWGLWHLPITPIAAPLTTVTSLVIVHGAVGVALSAAWRRTGNLAVPGFAHALIDAVREGLLTP